jgi:hypothetical protein
MKLGISIAAFAFSFALAGPPVATACPGGDKDPSTQFCPGGDKDPASCPGGDKDPASCPGGDKDPAQH